MHARCYLHACLVLTSGSANECSCGCINITSVQRISEAHGMLPADAVILGLLRKPSAKAVSEFHDASNTLLLSLISPDLISTLTHSHFW